MAPIRFVFGLHLHQPVGNFDHVFEQHVQDVYRPILEQLSARDFLPASAAPLRSAARVARGARHARTSICWAGWWRTGKIELLLAGFYEPVLASLPRATGSSRSSGCTMPSAGGSVSTPEGSGSPNGCGSRSSPPTWPDAGVRYALVDDRHFLVSGFASDQLHAPFWTESDGKRVALFPIDERLRYLIPFRPPEETAAYLRELRGAGHRLAVLADDGEKFGGWPGTKEWVYERGWLDQFIGAIGGLVESGEVQLSTLSDALDTVPSGGIAYLPTASYREMEGWSLPPDAALRLIRLERDLGEARVAGPDGALIRGAHWRNFLVKYSESNRMHKKMQALSLLCRQRGDPPPLAGPSAGPSATTPTGTACSADSTCPHLREAIWRNLALAEAELRRDEELCGGDARPRRRRSRRDLDPLGPVLRAREPAPGRRGRGVHHLRQRHQLRQHPHPTARGLPRDRPGESGRGDARGRFRHPQHTPYRGGTTVPPAPRARRRSPGRVRRPGAPGQSRVGGVRLGRIRAVRTWARVDCTFSIRRSGGSRWEIACGFTDGGSTQCNGEAADVCAGRWGARGGVPVGTLRWGARTTCSRPSFRSLLQSSSAPSRPPTSPTFPIETVAKSERGLDRTNRVNPSPFGGPFLSGKDQWSSFPPPRFNTPPYCPATYSVSALSARPRQARDRG